MPEPFPAANVPGSTAEQLPDHLLALLDVHLLSYTSTACQTADDCDDAAEKQPIGSPTWTELHATAERLRSRCRINQKFTGQLCAAPHHPENHHA